MTRAVLEAREQGAAERTLAAIPSAAMAVPATLHASLMARLDRLGARQGGCTDRGRNRPRVFPCFVSGSNTEARGGTPVSPRPSGCCRFVVPAGRPAAGHLSVSSTHWYRTPPMAHCCASHDARYMPASLKLSKTDFADIADSQPEVLARHCTEAGLIEKAAAVGQGWTAVLGALGPGGSHRAVTRALDQIATLPATPALRREQIKLQVALITPRPSRQRIRRTGNQGGCGASTSADRASRSARRAS